jgi:hypothetical protein
MIAVRRDSVATDEIAKSEKEHSLRLRSKNAPTVYALRFAFC